MDGFIFEAEELAYLLTLVGARGLAGVDDARLSAESDGDKVDRTDIYAKGLDSLKAHNWLTPTNLPGQFQLDETLARVMLALAEPHYAVLTSVEPDSGNAGRAMVDYLSSDGIVELTQSTDDLYHLGLVTDIRSLAERITSLLRQNADVPTGVPPSAEKLSRLTSQRGEVIVAQTSQDELLGGRRANVYAGAWIAWRRSATSEDMIVSPLNGDKVTQFLDEFMSITQV
jgi:hypothetical protein